MIFEGKFQVMEFRRDLKPWRSPCGFLCFKNPWEKNTLKQNMSEGHSKDIKTTLAGGFSPTPLKNMLISPRIRGENNKIQIELPPPGTSRFQRNKDVSLEGRKEPPNSHPGRVKRRQLGTFKGYTNITIFTNYLEDHPSWVSS